METEKREITRKFREAIVADTSNEIAVEQHVHLHTDTETENLRR